MSVSFESQTDSAPSGVEPGDSFRSALAEVDKVREWLSHVPPVSERASLRREFGYSIERLARLIGAHHQTLAKFERGETQLRGEALEKYALFCAYATKGRQ